MSCQAANVTWHQNKFGYLWMLCLKQWKGWNEGLWSGAEGNVGLGKKVDEWFIHRYSESLGQLSKTKQPRRGEEDNDRGTCHTMSSDQQTDSSVQFVINSVKHRRHTDRSQVWMWWHWERAVGVAEKEYSKCFPSRCEILKKKKVFHRMH